MSLSSCVRVPFTVSLGLFLVVALSGVAAPQGAERIRSPLQAQPGQTALSGQVLTLNGKPLAEVTLAIDGHTTWTDNRGQFLLVVPDGGMHEVEIDGRTANTRRKTYGLFEVGVYLTPGQTTLLPYTIWMPQLDTAHAVTIPSPTTTAVVVTTPQIPGLELHLPPGRSSRTTTTRWSRNSVSPRFPWTGPPSQCRHGVKCRSISPFSLGAPTSTIRKVWAPG